MIRAQLEIAYSIGSNHIWVVFATAVESPNKIDHQENQEKTYHP